MFKVRSVFLNAFRMNCKRRSCSSYNKAIEALNGLQTNAAVLEQVRVERQRNVGLNLSRTNFYLKCSGLDPEALDCLPVIHVSGTKGKGSTCAFVESILRRSGLKTGFYSSPHLVSVTERIRINGAPISRPKFAQHFWTVYDNIGTQTGGDRPPYFKFLTILAFNVFVAEKVDVAIIEVGIGGAYDCTNVIRKPVACAIANLDLDHTRLLGHTIAEIAWHKAGIMKPGSVAFIDGKQPEDALRVIAQRAKEIGCEAYTIPALADYDWGPYPSQELGLYRPIHSRNASLALQLSRFFINRQENQQQQRGEVLSPAPAFRLSCAEALGLKLTSWPGRAQVVHTGGPCTYYLDGAHTEQSIWACMEWFDQVCPLSQDKGAVVKAKRVLVFNATGDRKPEVLLRPLTSCMFDLVIFCTNVSKIEGIDSDNNNVTQSMDGAKKRCAMHKHIWDDLQATIALNNPDLEPVRSEVVTFIEDALDLANFEPETEKNVLVTGSLHLVGGVLNLIQPDCNEKSAKQVQTEAEMAEKYSQCEQTLLQATNSSK